MKVISGFQEKVAVYHLL